MEGNAIGAIGIAVCALLCGIGSAVGLCYTGRAAAGVLAENQKKYGSVIVLALLPATQGLYGFAMALIANGKLADITTAAQGWQLFAAMMPLAIVGMFSGIFQGKTSVGALNAIAKKEIAVGKLLVFPGTIEFYAILGFVISLIMMNAIVL